MTKLRLNTYGRITRIDRAHHILHGVSTMQAVEALGHNAIIDHYALRQFVALANEQPHGLKSRFTHPGLSSDGLGKFLGRAKNFRIHADKAVADLHLSPVAARSPHGDLRAYILDLAEHDPHAFGMSAVVTAKRVWLTPAGHETDAAKNPRPDDATTEKPLLRIVAAHAVDAVDEPAANRDGVFAAFSGTTSATAAHLFTALDTLLAAYRPRLPELLHRFLTAGHTGEPPIDDHVTRILDAYGIDLPKAQSFAARYWQHRQIHPPAGAPAPVPTDIALTLSIPPSPQGDPPMPTKQPQTQPPDSTAPTDNAAPAASVAPAPPTPSVAPAPPTPSAAPAPPTPSAAQAAPTAPLLTDPLLTEWQTEARAQVIHNMLAQSGLPEIVQRRLARAAYADPLALRTAITEAHAELQALEDELGRQDVIDLPDRPRRQPDIHVADALAEAQGHLDWFFGVPDAPLPPGNLRNIRDLYWALTGDFDWYGRFIPDQVQLAGATTTTLPDMAVNAMNKVIATQWSRLRYYRWYELVATVTPNDGSVHDMQWISFGGIADLPAVAERQGYGELEVGDVRESDPFSKYGGFVGITLEMIRNSNVMEIQAVPRSLAVASLRTRSAKIAAIFTANSGAGPTLDQDNKSLFHNDHANLDTTALGSTTAAWEAASQECFDQPEINSGKKLAAFAKYCLVPSALYFQALRNFGYGDGNPTTYNPFAVADRAPEDPRPVVLAVPEWTDLNDWAYLVDPQLYPVIMMSYAQNPGGAIHPQPELFTVPTETGLLFSNDTLPVKVRDWFSYGVNGYRGIGKRNVT